ncbi:MAG: hypothetical protein RIB64_22285, partial [Arenibacter algicola]
MNRIFKSILFLILFILIYPSSLFGQMIDLGQAKIISLEKQDPLVLNAINILQEEISKRSNITLTKGSKFQNRSQRAIVIGLENGLDKFPLEYRQFLATMPEIKAEGYKIA